ncbi:class I SAM-dependent methyltransferase [Nisaea acidiphila]|uniref:Class I SAM-dependent methyltransferase n=1 Tax=Nisaea acidiphila TaxID=1862145 RepID=A0A9J7AWG3_9PROT|nr:class I SAM-dependent methyltransferase [Nisaea acidiphila]UUX51138.1 class I SAM-dependent methyltransferase [Nisaea acidiphila]
MTLYNREFYEAIKASAVRSARVIVPKVLELTGPVRSVVDLGCGLGGWLSVFREHGANRVLGLDGDYVQRDMMEMDDEDFRPTDLAQPIRFDDKFDLSMSLEVVEHLPPDRADSFVEDLIRMAPVVLFSAAVPAQGGDGHQNEQWQHVWVEKFATHGYRAIDSLRPDIWSNTEVSWWYRQNLLLFASDAAIAERAPLRLAHEQTDLRQVSTIHPTAYLARVSFFKKAYSELHAEKEELRARLAALEAKS